MSIHNCRCDVCSAIYVMTPGRFGVCPNGHGELIPGVTQREISMVLAASKAAARQKESLAQLRLLPLCRYVREASSWAVYGREGCCYRRVAGPYKPSSLDGMEPHHTEAGRLIARTVWDRWCALEEIG